MSDLKRGTAGESVRDLQEALLGLGFPLPRYGADGSLGTETLEAVDAWAEMQNLEGDYTPNDTVLEATMAQIFAQYASAKDASVLSPRILDVREHYTGPKGGKNPWSQIDTICLHQMAVKGPGGWKRWKSLAIHFAVLHKDGVAAWLVDLDTRVPHGHGWNKRSVGFEIEGHFSGVVADPKTHWVPQNPSPSRKIPMEPSPEQVLAAHDAIRFTCTEVEKHGGKIKYIGAHRQSYGMKASDPGELVWKYIALPMMQELGLTTGPTLYHHKYTGKPIPEAWDPDQIGVPY